MDKIVEKDVKGERIVRYRSRRVGSRDVDRKKFGDNLDAIIANEKRKREKNQKK